jgi:exonuclease SbcC
MIELVTVELTNFRSFSHATFEPLGIGQGMTAINGANGMGKSSVVHAIVWALYGVTPDGVRVGSLRRQDSEGDTEVKVTLRHDGQTIVIVRAIRGRNDTTVASIEVDGIEQTNVSSRTATNWIVSRFGLDAEAFLTAFVIRQKELDSLIRARPADRRKTIERLAGIERMSKALELARGEARIAQKAFDSLPVLPDITNLEEAFAQAEKDLKSLQKTSNENKTLVAEVFEKYNSAKTNLTQARELANKVNQLESKLEVAETYLSNAEEKYRAAEKLALLAEGSETLIEENETLTNSLSILQTQIAEAQNALNKVSSLTESLSVTLNKKATAEKSLLELNSILSSKAEASKNDDLDELGNRRVTAEKKIAELNVQKGAALGEWDRLKKALDTLTSHDLDSSHDAECPTCFSKLDDVEILVKSLSDSQKLVLEKGKAITAEISAEETNLASLILSMSSIVKEQEEIARLKSDVARVQTEIASLQEEVDKAEEDIVTFSAKTTDLDKFKTEHSEIDAAQRKIANQLSKIEASIEAKNSLPELKLAYEAKKAELESLSEEYQKSLSQLENLDIVELEEDYEELGNEYSVLSEQKNDLNISLSLAERTLSETSEKIELALSEQEKRKALLSEVQSKTTSASTLDEFRRDRLARLTPELSEVASDFVSRMTDGKYTSVVLDEDFTPILTDSSGAERPVAWLSGGEESAVALALRVAIGEVLAGQRGGLLVLDEALTAQDASRRQSTMGAIRALPRQIITINHVSEATDMVDLVAEVVLADDGGSTIQEVVPENGKVSSVSDEMIDA